MPKKDYIERHITEVGRTTDTDEGKACPVCKDADEFFSAAEKHDNRISYTKIEIDSPEGQEIAEKEDIRGMPFIKDCRTFEKGKKPRCREIEGFEPDDDWSDIQELIETNKEKAAEPQSQSESKSEPETPKEEFEEPIEPEEPK